MDEYEEEEREQQQQQETEKEKERLESLKERGGVKHGNHVIWEQKMLIYFVGRFKGIPPPLGSTLFVRIPRGQQKEASLHNFICCFF